MWKVLSKLEILRDMGWLVWHGITLVTVTVEWPQGGMVGNWPPTFAKMVLEISLKLIRKKCREGVVANLQRNRGCSHVILSFIPPVFIAMATPMYSNIHWINRPTSYFLHFKLYHVFC